MVLYPVKNPKKQVIVTQEKAFTENTPQKVYKCFQYYYCFFVGKDNIYKNFAFFCFVHPSHWTILIHQKLQENKRL